MMLFQYNNQQWFNTDSIETIDDTGSDMVVTLKSGRRCYVHYSDQDKFLAAIAPADQEYEEAEGRIASSGFSKVDTE